MSLTVARLLSYGHRRWASRSCCRVQRSGGALPWQSRTMQPSSAQVGLIMPDHTSESSSHCSDTAQAERLATCKVSGNTHMLRLGLHFVRAEMEIVAAMLTAQFGNAKVDSEQELVLLQVLLGPVHVVLYTLEPLSHLSAEFAGSRVDAAAPDA
jgi:hypothetical protein